MAATGPELQAQLLDIVTQSIQDKLDIDKLLFDISALGAPADVSETLADVFWLLWIKLESSTHLDQRLKLVEVVQECLAAKKLDRRQAMEVLDPELLQGAKMLPTVAKWTTKETQVKTKTYYAQRKFNLLREDSEGYARVITALNHFGEGALTEAGSGTLFKEVRALIGYFDLDPNRVLDLVLEAAEQQQQQPQAAAGTVAAAAYYPLIPLFKKEAVVQLLGFKLQQYQSKSGEGSGTPPAASGPAPQNLFLLAASLVAAGTVDLGQLLSNLSPSDEHIRSAQQSANAALAADVGRIGAQNLSGLGSGTGSLGAQVSDAGGGSGGPPAGGSGFSSVALPRRSGLSAADLEIDASKLLEQRLLPADAEHNQLLSLTQAMLQVGKWEHAQLLLERLALLGLQVAAHVPSCTALCARLSRELAPIVAALYPNGVLAKSIFSLPRSVTAPGPPLSGHAEELLNHLGLYLHRDKTLFTQTVRVLRHHLVFFGTPDAETSETAKAAAEAERCRVEKLVMRVILPSMMLCPTNPALVDEVWQLLRLFHYSTRFEFYADLKDITETAPLLRASAKLALSETRKVLRRVVLPPDKRERKEACKPFARLLAKVTHSNPLAVIEALVSQAEAYPNLTDAILEALKYMVPLSFDVLSFIVVQHLAADRAKVKDDGINPSSWLQHLAQFVGQVCRKHADVELAGLAQFLATELRHEDSTGLLVLGQLIQQMTGVTVVTELGEKQLEATAGGPLLQQEVIYASDNVDKTQKQWRTGNRRLLDALTQGPKEQHLLLPLLILMAQQRSAVIMTRMPAEHIKSVVSMYDQCQETMVQYIDWLQRVLGPQEYAALLPPLEDLRKEYGLDADIVYHLYRPMLGQLLSETAANDVPAVAEDDEIEEGEQVPDTQAAAEGAGAQDANGSTAASTRSDVAMTDAPSGEAGTPAAAAVGPAVAGMTWERVLAVVAETVPKESTPAMSPELYATFWTLSLHDIFLPVNRYEDVIDALERELRQSYERMPRGYQSEEQEAIWRKEKALKQDHLAAIRAEYAAHRAHVEAVMARLKARQDKYLTHLPHNRRKDMAGWLTLECLLPRCLFSPADAVFCARFIQTMHDLSVPYFSTVWTYNAVLRDMVAVLTGCSDRESTNMGIFLLEVLRTLNHWRSSERVYNDECLSKPGFAVSLTEPNANRTPYDMYKKLTTRWFQGPHPSLFSVFRNCLESTEYVAIRNGLSVLSKIVEVYPVVDKFAEELKRLALRLHENDARDDIKIMAKSYVAALQAQIQRGRMVSMEQYGGAAAGKGKNAKARAGVASTAAAAPDKSRAGGGPARPSPGAPPLGTQLPAPAAGSVAITADNAMRAPSVRAPSPARTSSPATTRPVSSPPSKSGAVAAAATAMPPPPDVPPRGAKKARVGERSERDIAGGADATPDSAAGTAASLQGDAALTQLTRASSRRDTAEAAAMAAQLPSRSSKREQQAEALAQAQALRVKREADAAGDGSYGKRQRVESAMPPADNGSASKAREGLGQLAQQQRRGARDSSAAGLRGSSAADFEREVMISPPRGSTAVAGAADRPPSVRGGEQQEDAVPGGRERQQEARGSERGNIDQHRAGRDIRSIERGMAGPPRDGPGAHPVVFAGGSGTGRAAAMAPDVAGAAADGKAPPKLDRLQMKALKKEAERKQKELREQEATAALLETPQAMAREALPSHDTEPVVSWPDRDGRGSSGGGSRGGGGSSGGAGERHAAAVAAMALDDRYAPPADEPRASRERDSADRTRLDALGNGGGGASAAGAGSGRHKRKVADAAAAAEASIAAPSEANASSDLRMVLNSRHVSERDGGGRGGIGEERAHRAPTDASGAGLDGGGRRRQRDEGGVKGHEGMLEGHQTGRRRK